MKLKKIINELELNLLTQSCEDQDIEDGLSSDLLSHVLSEGRKGMIWVTVQRHINIIAVASSVEIGAIVVSGRIPPSEEVIEVAEANNICLLATEESSFSLCGKIYRMLMNEMV